MKILIIFLIIQTPWKKLFKTFKMDERDFYIKDEYMNFYGGGKGKLFIYDVFRKNPFVIENYIKTIAGIIIQRDTLPNFLLSTASFLINKNVRRDLIKNPVKEYWKGINKKGLSKIISFYIKATQNTKKWIDYAFEEIKRDSILKLIKSYFYEEDSKLLESSIDKVDYLYLFTGAMDFCLIINEIIDSLKNCDFENEYYEKTPYGDIIIRGKENDTILLENPFLVIDFGGDDVYISKLKKIPYFSLIIDVSGNDVYKANSFSFGAGILSYSVLIDFKGNDKYYCEFGGLGSGIFGTGMLIDFEGNDFYDGKVFGQGAGAFGSGILFDKKGNDIYHIYQYGQGFGYHLGSGLLFDKYGDDKYIGEDKDIIFPSPQTKEHNANLVQGMGFGKRADYIDGHSLAGGIGLLIDYKGNDKYSAGVFAQGCSYWYGVGILFDEEGNDSLKGIWYVQGAGAHFGVGILLNLKGNDFYYAEKNMAQGAGHDFTLGYFMDEKGNDKYFSPNLSLGAGNANGMGIFIDKEGNDEYNIKKGINLGDANLKLRFLSLRKNMPTYGVFFDLGGRDKYKLKGRNKKKWFKITENNEYGFGFDK